MVGSTVVPPQPENASSPNVLSHLVDACVANAYKSSPEYLATHIFAF